MKIIATIIISYLIGGAYYVWGANPATTSQALVRRCVCSPCLIAWWHMGAELCGLSLNPWPTGNQSLAAFAIALL